jgi:hypothetical protein
MQEPPRVNFESKNKKFMLRVNSPNKTYWELFIIALAIYNSFQIPIEIAYHPVSMESAGFTLLNTLIDMCFLADIIVQFRTTFYDPETGD